MRAVIKEMPALIWVACYKLTAIWAPTKKIMLADSFSRPIWQWLEERYRKPLLEVFTESWLWKAHPLPHQYSGTLPCTSSPPSSYLFRYPFHPRVTTVARKRSRSFCRWQVTAKHAYTLRVWLCMKSHGAWLYGVHRTCAETAAVSCGTSHASAVSTPLRWIFKKKKKKKRS